MQPDQTTLRAHLRARSDFLDAQRILELAHRAEEDVAALLALDGMVAALAPSMPRRHDLGMIEQQRLFRRWAERHG